MQDDNQGNMDKEKLFILPIPIAPQYGYDNPGMHSRDITFITHNHYGNNMANPMMTNMMQMMEMQRALSATQSLLIEQRNFTKALAQETMRLMDARQGNNQVEILEDKREKKTIIADSKNIEDVFYEILDSKKQENEEKTNLKEKEMENKEINKDLAAIKKSIEKQMASNNEPPYHLEGKVSGTQEHTIVSAPVIFTVRNDVWRDRVRYIMKEYFYNERTHKLLKSENQENANMAAVVFYSGGKEKPVEIIVVYQVPLDKYLSFDPPLTVKESMAIDKFVISTINSFSLPIHTYTIIAEPMLDCKEDYPVLTGDDTNTLADLVKIKPVLSFSKKEQRIAVSTYYQNTFERKVNPVFF